MKALSPIAAAQRYAESQDAVWLLEIAGNLAQPWRAATREITLATVHYPGSIAAPPKWSMASAREFGAGGVVITRAEARAADVIGGADSLRARLAEGRVIGRPATLKLLWLSPEEEPALEAAVTMLRGQVTGWTSDVTSVTLELADRIAAEWNRRVGRVLTPHMTGGAASPSMGKPLPILFGAHAAAPLLELNSGAAAKLAGPMLPGDGVARLVSLAGFPPSGAVQIGAERMTYSALDAGAMTLGTEASPLVRAERATLHAKGETARLIPEGGFTWIVADHPCAAVEEVSADGAPLAPEDWSAGTAQLGNEAAEIVTLARWPVRLRYEGAARPREAAETFGADVYSPAAANTAENPERAIDAERTSTAARLGAGAGLLAIKIARRIAGEGERLGIWSGARVRARYSASRRWGAASRLIARMKLGAAEAAAEIPRPEPEETEASPGGGEEPAETPTGVREFEFDASALLAEGWEAFDGAIEAEMHLEFIAVDDATTVFAHDLELRVSFFALLGAEEAREFSARARGWRDEATLEAMENPADILKALLSHRRFASLEASEIDEASFAAVRAALEADGFAFARRIADGPAAGDLIESAAREAGVWVRMGGDKAGLARAAASPAPAEATERLDDAKALRADAASQLEAPAGGFASDALILVPAHAEETGLWTRRTDGFESDGAYPASMRLKWLDGRSQRALAALGERIQALLREPAVALEQSYPLGAAALEPGDGVTVDRAPLGLLETPAWIERVKIRGGSRAEIRLRGPEAGEICWQADQLTLLRAMGFGGRLAIFIEGRLVAALERSGRLCIAGTLREEFAPPGGPFAGPIAFSAGAIYFCTGTAGAFDPFMRIDGEGNVELGGTLREESLLEFGAAAACHGADAERFWLSPHAPEAAFEYRAAEKRLHIKGILTERSQL